MPPRTSPSAVAASATRTKGEHGHELTIQPNSDNYALDIRIGTSGAEEALGAEEIMTLESAPYSAAGRPENR